MGLQQCVGTCVMLMLHFVLQRHQFKILVNLHHVDRIVNVGKLICKLFALAFRATLDHRRYADLSVLSTANVILLKHVSTKNVTIRVLTPVG